MSLTMCISKLLNRKIPRVTFLSISTTNTEAPNISLLIMRWNIYMFKCVDLQLKWPHCESLIEAFTSAVATFLAIALGKYLTAFFI